MATSRLPDRSWEDLATICIRCQPPTVVIIQVVFAYGYDSRRAATHGAREALQVGAPCRQGAGHSSVDLRRARARAKSRRPRLWPGRREKICAALRGYA